MQKGLIIERWFILGAGNARLLVSPCPAEGLLLAVSLDGVAEAIHPARRLLSPLEFLPLWLSPLYLLLSTVQPSSSDHPLIITPNYHR